MDPPPDCSSCYMKSDESCPVVERNASVQEGVYGKPLSKTVDKSLATSSVGRENNKTLLNWTMPRLLSSSDTTTVTTGYSTVHTYSAAKMAVFAPLAPKTDLNLTPSNWLRKTVGLRPETVLTGSRNATNQSSFSGLVMANNQLECVGKVDIISDAENLKKLLKIPYSKAHVSMAIHRIGRTLLLENFDIKKYTAEESEWKWFRTFFRKLDQHGHESLLKKKSPESQHERLMLSKFLYYSVNQEYGGGNGGQETFHDLPEEESCKSRDKLHIEFEDKIKEEGKLENGDTASSSEASSVFPSGSENLNAVVAAETRWRYWTPRDSFAMPEGGQNFERNIVWTFEDLKMLLGTNMPIFGGGKYPAVSLRLRDSNKPINILTGIDYWLDNLIWNVPDLIMYFHVDGIVQNFEVIKTEEIPHLEHSGFSPQVVKDIAQNILSFLKSNCTKEGHTYWLFKGSGDDVVKLYDLTTMCKANIEGTSSSTDDMLQNNQQNPFSFSVAMLLYRTAISLMQSNDQCDHRVTVKKLLRRCVKLLDQTKYQYVVCSATCMLSTLCLPDPGLNVTAKKTPLDLKSPAPQDLEDCEYWRSCDTCQAHRNRDCQIASNAENSDVAADITEVASIPSVSVTDLSTPERFQHASSPLDLLVSPEEKGADKCHREADIIEDKCKDALSYIVLGLSFLTDRSQKNLHKKEDRHSSLLLQLTRNAALAYFRLAEKASNVNELERALHFVKLALKSYETFDLLSKSANPDAGERSTGFDDELNNCHISPPDFNLLLPRLLSLCGEIQFGLFQIVKKEGGVRDSANEYLELRQDGQIAESLKKIFPDQPGDCCALAEPSDDPDTILTACKQCYEKALDTVCTVTGKKRTKSCGPNSPMNLTKHGPKDCRRKGRRSAEKTQSQAQPPLDCPFETRQNEVAHDLQIALLRRLGSISNELGASALNQAVLLLDNTAAEDGPSQKEFSVWKQARSYFDTAHDCFDKVHDVINQALVLSNMGRLKRVCTRSYGNCSAGDSLTKQERKCYEQAFEHYLKALSCLKPKDGKRTSTGAKQCEYDAAYDNISWELSSTYFSMVQIIQDDAPGPSNAREEAEKEIVDLLNKSLKYCQDIWIGTPKLALVSYRQAKIHHRLASLYHYASRNCNDSTKGKHMRHLADQHYIKAASFLESPDHPNELLRVYLERLAMKDHYLTSSSKSTNQKSKVLLEALEILKDCVKPLELISTSQNSDVNSKSSHAVDPFLTESDSSSVAECLNLIGILGKILQSILLSVVRTKPSSASNPSKGKTSSPVRSSQSSHQSYKELYSRTLRSLQPLTSTDKPKTFVPPSESRNNKDVHPQSDSLRSNVKLVVGVLQDVFSILK